MTAVEIRDGDLLKHADDLQAKADLIIASTIHTTPQWDRLFRYQSSVLSGMLKQNGTLVCITGDGYMSTRAVDDEFNPLRMGRWIHGMVQGPCKLNQLNRSSVDIVFAEKIHQRWLADLHERLDECGVDHGSLGRMMKRGTSAFLSEWLVGLSVPTKDEWEAMTKIMSSLTVLDPMTPFEQAVRYYNPQDGWSGDVWNFPRPHLLDRDRVPAEVIRKIICMSCPPGGMVLDVWAKYPDVINECHIAGCNVIAGDFLGNLRGADHGR